MQAPRQPFPGLLVSDVVSAMGLIPEDGALTMEDLEALLSEDACGTVAAAVPSGGSDDTNAFLTSRSGRPQRAAAAPRPVTKAPATAGTRCGLAAAGAPESEHFASDDEDDDQIARRRAKKKRTQALYRQRKREADAQLVQQLQEAEARIRAAEEERQRLIALRRGYEQMANYQLEATHALSAAQCLPSSHLDADPLPNLFPSDAHLHARGLPPAIEAAALASLSEPPAPPHPSGIMSRLCSSVVQLAQLFNLETLFQKEYNPPDVLLRWLARGVDQRWLVKREAEMRDVLRRDLDLWESDPSAHPAIERRLTAWYRRRGRFMKVLSEMHPDMMHRHLVKVGIPVLPEDGGAEEHPKHAPFRTIRVSLAGHWVAMSPPPEAPPSLLVFAPRLTPPLLIFFAVF